MDEQSQYIEELLARSNGQTLYQHTKEVIDYSLQIYGEGPLKKELELAALFHDFGKAQDKYQRFYRGDNTGQREHAVASAWICQFLSAIHKDLNCIIARLVEAHHKGLRQSNDTTTKISALRDALNALQNILSSKDRILELVEEQRIKTNDLQQVTSILEMLIKKSELQPATVNAKLGMLERDLAKRRDVDVSLLLEVRKALGALVVADSLSATGLKPDVLETKRMSIKPNRIHKFVQDASKNRPIDRIREKIGQRVEEVAKTIDLSQKIFTISLPTGAGKTLHSLRFAIILRERVEKELNTDPPRILYVMPFTTIIDQAYDIFAKIYENAIDKRHYLADEKTNNEIPEELHSIVRLLYPAEITVTTYVQLYSALVGNGRRDAIRALGLKNRIIILDEVQAIPYAHWSIMKELIQTLARDNWIVLMSATVPRHVVPENATKIVESQNVPRIDIFNRHTFIQSKYDTYESVVKDAVKRYLNGESVTIVVNTVRTAEDMYLTAKEILASQGIKITATESGAHHRGGSVVYLSTYVPPFARSNRIERFEDHVLAITTQVIEAGIDVSVDVLYRELAPVDSIVQAAGRCNRNGERDSGEVIIFRTPDTEKKFKSVYGEVLWAATLASLKGMETFTDKDVDAILHTYYEYLKKSKKDDEILEMAKKSVENCSFAVDIHIIENIPRVPVVVMYPEAQTIVDKLREIYRSKDRDRKIVSQLFRNLGKYIVNVYPKQAERFEPIDGVGNNVLYCVRPGDENNYIKDVGVLYNPKKDPNAFEDRLA